jgi:hypothetical protein
VPSRASLEHAGEKMGYILSHHTTEVLLCSRDIVNEMCNTIGKVFNLDGTIFLISDHVLGHTMIDEHEIRLD